MPDYVFIDAETREALEYQRLENKEEAIEWAEKFWPGRNVDITAVVSYGDERKEQE